MLFKPSQGTEQLHEGYCYYCKYTNRRATTQIELLWQAEALCRTLTSFSNLIARDGKRGLVLMYIIHALCAMLGADNVQIE